MDLNCKQVYRVSLLQLHLRGRSLEQFGDDGRHAFQCMTQDDDGCQEQLYDFLGRTLLMRLGAYKQNQHT